MSQEAGNRHSIEGVLGARLVDDAGAAIGGRLGGGLVLIQMAPADYERYQGATGHYQADVQLIARRATVGDVLPLRPGSSGPGR